jgi:UDP-2,3-diacylglucosamine hydrolase
VVGLPTVEAMKKAGATGLAIDAGRTLLFDREKLIEIADDAGITIQAFSAAPAAEPRNESQGMNKG